MIKFTKHPFVRGEYFVDTEFSSAKETHEVIDWLNTYAKGWNFDNKILRIPDKEKDLIFQLRWL